MMFELMTLDRTKHHHEYCLDVNSSERKRGCGTQRCFASVNISPTPHLAFNETSTLGNITDFDLLFSEAQNGMRESLFLRVSRARNPSRKRL